MIVIANAANTPQRFQREFYKFTRVSVQVRGGNTVTIGREQGEVASAPAGGAPPDGIQLTASSTAQPYDSWWIGELWFSSTAAGPAFNLLVIGSVG